MYHWLSSALPASKRVIHKSGSGNLTTPMFALATAGPGNVPQCPPSSGEQSGAQVGDTVDGDSYTAVFSGNDQMALGFMSAVRRRGKTAPEDFSIVGVDDMPDARYFAPALTSIYMDFVTLGRVGIEMLIERITTADRVERRVIRPELIVRESTAPVEATAEARTPGAGRPTRRHP